MFIVLNRSCLFLPKRCGFCAKATNVSRRTFGRPLLLFSPQKRPTLIVRDIPAQRKQKQIRRSAFPARSLFWHAASFSKKTKPHAPYKA